MPLWLRRSRSSVLDLDFRDQLLWPHRCYGEGISLKCTTTQHITTHMHVYKIWSLFHTAHTDHPRVLWPIDLGGSFHIVPFVASDLWHTLWHNIIKTLHTFYLLSRFATLILCISSRGRAGDRVMTAHVLFQIYDNMWISVSSWDYALYCVYCII